MEIYLDPNNPPQIEKLLEDVGAEGEVGAESDLGTKERFARLRRLATASLVRLAESAATSRTDRIKLLTELVAAGKQTPHSRRQGA